MTDTPRLAPIFISYSFQDAAQAQRVVAALEGMGLTPWLAQAEVGPGESFVQGINSALKEASYVLLLVSRASMASPWVEREWMSSLARKGTVLLPLRLDDEPLPPLLADLIFIDLRAPSGLGELEAFFRRELTPAVEPMRDTHPGGLGLTTAPRRELRLAMQRCLDRLAFRNLLFDLEIDEGELPGESLHEKVLFLVHAVEHRDVLAQMIDFVERDHGPCIRAQLTRLRTPP